MDASSPEEDNEDVTRSSFTNKTKVMLEYLHTSFVGDEPQPNTGSKRKRSSTANGTTTPAQEQVSSVCQRKPEAYQQLLSNIAGVTGLASLASPCRLHSGVLTMHRSQVLAPTQPAHVQQMFGCVIF